MKLPMIRRKEQPPPRPLSDGTPHPISIAGLEFYSHKQAARETGISTRSLAKSVMLPEPEAYLAHHVLYKASQVNDPKARLSAFHDALMLLQFSVDSLTNRIVSEQAGEG